MRLAVIGSKEFHDYLKLKSVLDGIAGITAIGYLGKLGGSFFLGCKYC